MFYQKIRQILRFFLPSNDQDFFRIQLDHHVISSRLQEIQSMTPFIGMQIQNQAIVQDLQVGADASTDEYLGFTHAGGSMLTSTSPWNGWEEPPSITDAIVQLHGSVKVI